MDRFCVIMAGGGGTRFWPLSRQKMPKQFLNLTGNNTMVNETIDGIANNVPKENIYIITNNEQTELMKEVTKGRIGEDRILSEPVSRNTAACIGYAAVVLQQKYGDSIMCVLASDYYIKSHQIYSEVMDYAIKLAEDRNQLVTIGIKPTSPATDYGYIKYNKRKKEIGHAIGAVSQKRIMAYSVDDFVEKPSLSTARSYVEQGGYLWNSGMFVWKTSVILNYFKNLLPDIYQRLKEIEEAVGTDKEKEVVERIYRTMPQISIDYGIMERAEDVIVLEGDFGWYDVGSWDVLDMLYHTDENRNVVYGEQIHLETKNCIVYAKDKLVATIGLDNIVVVETEDATLVCDKGRTQDVKKIVECLKEQNQVRYL